MAARAFRLSKHDLSITSQSRTWANDKQRNSTYVLWTETINVTLLFMSSENGETFA